MDVVKNEWEQLNSDASNLYQNAKNEAQIRYNKEMAMHQIRKDDEVSEQDKQIAAAVLAAMQAGVADGETSPFPTGKLLRSNGKAPPDQP